MSDLGRIFVYFGLLLAAIGLALIILNRFDIPLGRLPGDLSWRGRGWSFSFPLASSLLLSVVLSLLFWVIGRFHR
jgi:hypothetical protein